MIFNLLAPFVHAPQLEGPKVYVPESVADFFETDVLARQRVRDAHPSLLPADAAIAADEPDFKVPGVFERGQAPWPLARRGQIVLRRCLLIERFVRPIVVVFLAEAIEAELLGAQRPAWGTRRFGLERAMHALMAPVLLR